MKTLTILLIAAVLGVILLIVYACCKVSGDISREEERREWERLCNEKWGKK